MTTPATDVVRKRLRWFGKRHGAILAIVAAGLFARVAVWSYATQDTYDYLLPWYSHAKMRGWSALGDDFTNYTPLYSYLLILVAKLDGLLPPLLLIKSISYLFELATAVLCRRLVLRLTKSDARALWAFAAAWLAPSVLYNGALWGQADSIWAFFSLLSVYLFTFNRSGGVIALALAFCSKAQGIFLGPFALGSALRQRRPRTAFLWIPVLYAAIALPVLAAGRSLSGVLLIYLDQASAFPTLSRNAASVWTLLPFFPYLPGVVIGLAVAGVAGLALAYKIWRSTRSDNEFMLLAACTSLLMMPYLLPKMHDRYFYAFELSAIILACSNPRYVLVAVVAQVDALLTYSAFDQHINAGVPFAAAQNGLLLLFLIDLLRKPVSAPQETKWADVAAYGAAASATLGVLWWLARSPTNHVALFLLLGLLSVTVLLLGVILLRMRRDAASTDAVETTPALGTPDSSREL